MDAFDSLVDAELRELQGSAQTGVGAFLPGESPQDDFNRQQINGQQQSDAVVKKSEQDRCLDVCSVACLHGSIWRPGGA